MTQLNMKVPKELVDAMRAAAQRKMMTRSEYVRQAVLAQLERDGAMPKREAA